MQNATPMLRQYLDIKKLYPGTILFFRLGDFYEMFNEDAVLASRELEITLTARHKETANPVPMCGVPHHAAASYIARLVRRGYRVAICEQTEEPGKGVKLVKREVVRVITPGTAIDDQLIESKDSVYLASICEDGEDHACSLLELSSGRFFATQVDGRGSLEKILDELATYGPREILCPRSLELSVSKAFSGEQGTSLFPNEPSAIARTSDATLTPLESSYFDLDTSDAVLRRQFGVNELTAFGLSGKSAAIKACGAALLYSHETQKASAGHIAGVEYHESSDFMTLDRVTLRNLDIVDPGSEKEKRTLFDVIDQSVTGMGSRLLRQWLLRPSIKRGEIQTRLSAVSELTDTILREKLRYLLKGISDLERLIGRLNLGTATPRDLIALARSVGQAPGINQVLSDANSLLLQVLAENIHELPETRELIERAISDEPPAKPGDGGVVRPGYDQELDELRSTSASAKQFIAALEEEERTRTGIGNLKIRYNSVFGYYIEVSKGNISLVPDDYERRQTVANAERYSTPKLKEWEQKVLGADERILKLENELFMRIRDKVTAETRKLQATARAFATLDALCSLAETAARRNYVVPVLHDGDEIEIKNGRHPIVEAFMTESFIPNDTLMNNSTDRLLIVTGANMGGKSTVLRQIALIQILAQIGSFVPADSARLPIIDRVWTRVGASDDLASGRSTFMVEMTETAAILHNATPRSLVLLDEIGRGTSTFDGLSIAWAVAEYLHDSPAHSAKTLFATHYHELTELAEKLPGAKNYQITASEKEGEVVFFHKLQPGKASKSYGIAVARLAGLPQTVIERARDVLAKLEKYELAVFSDEVRTGLAKAAGGHAVSQFSLFAVSNEGVIDEMRETDVDALDPADAKALLKEIKARII